MGRGGGRGGGGGPKEVRRGGSGEGEILFVSEQLYDDGKPKKIDNNKTRCVWSSEERD